MPDFRSIAGAMLASACLSPASLVGSAYGQEVTAETEAAPVNETAEVQLSAPVAIEVPDSLGVRLNSDGMLTATFLSRDPATGTRSAAENVDVRLLQRGRIVASGRAGSDGVVQLADVTPGLYSIVAVSPQGFYSCGLQVRRAADSYASSTPVAINGYLVDPVDYRTVGKFFNSTAMPAAPAATSSGQLLAGESESALQTPDLVVTADGRLSGEVSLLDPATGAARPLAGARVGLIRSGNVQSATVTDSKGQYFLDGLTPGGHTIAILSPAGFSVFGVEIQSAASLTGGDDGEGRYFVQAGGGSPMLQSGVTAGNGPGGAGLGPNGEGPGDVPPGPPVAGPPPFGGGMGGGGSFGGGAGGGFGGGLGGLLTGAALGGLAGYAISEADDDDDRDGSDRPVSPTGTQSEED